MASSSSSSGAPTFNGQPLPPPYHESPLDALALLSATLLGIYSTGLLFDRLCYAGLVAQLLVGALLGPPLLNIWPSDWLTTFRMLGDVGILLLVFSGGLAVDARLLRKHLAPAVATALLGGMLPIVFALMFFGACLQFPWIQAFTAGAALSSTSFGTTLVALGQADPNRIERRLRRFHGHSLEDFSNFVENQGADSSSDTQSMLGPLRTRVGTVLVAAAMLDDVVGLLLLSIITALAQSPEPTSIFTFETLGKPALASMAILTIPPLLAVYAVRPLARRCVPWVIRRVSADAVVYGLLAWMMLALGGLVAVSDVVGTTRVLGSFSAGLFVNLVGAPLSLKEESPAMASFLENVFNRSLGRVNHWLMLPLFFLSMGTPLPITHMFHWSILWQGLAYSLLMILAKALVGPIILHLFSTRGNSSSTAYRSPPALFLGLGLVARGEVGIIMAQVAHAASLAMSWGDILDTHTYLVVMWAILVCTMVGPVAFARYARLTWGEVVAHGEWGLAAANAEGRVMDGQDAVAWVECARPSMERVSKEGPVDMGAAEQVHVVVNDDAMMASAGSSRLSLHEHVAPVAIEMNGMSAVPK
ncbi:Sodium/hydrogen exchanger family-domain-containing protein [Catenaria anguillulae PL171]|uniref:Sodium/hydrogen exchanger family-domain-containing protein n=1 Tax=Catenaria anguillulae PL171 TaxID=765915 RepID=A0A1Y2I1S3_9FUNG|nr:Sodium/hydrogen exchanger family-domain-containing protein [Catenaria anguillulae PL171]